MLATTSWVFVMFETAREVMFAGASCSDLITSVALLDNMMQFLVGFIENIGGVLLALHKNMLELWLLAEWHEARLRSFAVLTADAVLGGV